MNVGSNSNASSTGTTPDNAAQNTPSLTEAQFLQQQAEQAQRAMSRTLSLLGTHLGQSVNPGAWTRAHPVTSLGAAAIGGFIAVTMIPSKQDRAMRRLAALERAIRADARRGIDPEPKHDGTNPVNNPRRRGGLVNRLVNELFATVRPAIMSAIIGAIQSKPQPEPPPPAPEAVPPVPPVEVEPNVSP